MLIIETKCHQCYLLERDGKYLTERYANARENESRIPVAYSADAFYNQKSPPILVSQHNLHNGTRNAPVRGYQIRLGGII